MEYSNLSTDIKVSKLQFGCSRLGKAALEDTTSIAMPILQQALESGINFFDTASNYTYGNSEKILGEFLKGRRDKVFIATKGGVLLSKKAIYGSILKPVYHVLRPLISKNKKLLKHKKRNNYDTEYLTKTLERSLQRLKTEYVDVYFLHNPPIEVVNDAKTAELFDKFKSEGKCRMTGHSLSSLHEVAELDSLEHIDIIQVPLNYSNFSEKDYALLSNLKSRGIKVIARSPFERGLLTQYDSQMTGGKKGLKNDELKARKQLLKEKFGLSDIELALSFVKDLDIIDSILFSSFKSDHLQKNIEIFKSNVADNFSWKEVTSTLST